MTREGDPGAERNRKASLSLPPGSLCGWQSLAAGEAALCRSLLRALCFSKTFVRLGFGSPSDMNLPAEHVRSL